MILSRITRAIREQNWFAVGLEFVIVIAGVVFGFQVTEWNTGRQDRREEAAVLSAMLEDTSHSIEVAASVAVLIGDQLAALERLTLVSDQPPEQDLPDGFQIDLHTGVFVFSLYNPQMLTFDDLRQSGRLALIRSRDIRRRLQEIDAIHAGIAETRADIVSVYYEFSDPYLIEHFDLRQTTFLPSAHSGNPGLEWLSPDENLRDLRAVARQREFQNILLYRGFIITGYRGQIERVIDHYAGLETALRERLATLGERA
ncbi:hypothetical protein [Maricaulis maris]|uniref:Uncharacterized protein n=1 Tax=Maricaulis maris TaxID=74318 RepID=A0A495D3D4_9PROT|nr:hypothetical protein [Maricaulis maris]RKQ96425.1 hypothetical protein C7435_1755 [Maricaulis maris]